MLGAIASQQRAARYAQFGLQRAWRVVQPGVDHAAVMPALMRADGGLPLDDENARAGIRPLQLASHRQSDDAGTDDRQAPHVPWSRPCTGTSLAPSVPWLQLRVVVRAQRVAASEATAPNQKETLMHPDDQSVTAPRVDGSAVPFGSPEAGEAAKEATLVRLRALSPESDPDAPSCAGLRSVDDELARLVYDSALDAAALDDGSGEGGILPPAQLRGAWRDARNGAWCGAPRGATRAPPAGCGRAAPP